MAFLVCSLLLLIFTLMTTYSSATYCVCKDGVGEQSLQKSLDYACGAGADCSPILQTGACYQPNTVKSHCDFAVNSYFQRKGQVQGSCDFSGTASPVQSLPSAVTSGCVYPSSPSNAGTPIPSTTPSTTTPTGSTTTPSVFGSGAISPTGSGGTLDGSGGVALTVTTHFTNLVFFSCLSLLFSAFLFLRD